MTLIKSIFEKNEYFSLYKPKIKKIFIKTYVWSILLMVVKRGRQVDMREIDSRRWRCGCE